MLLYLGIPDVAESWINAHTRNLENHDRLERERDNFTQLQKPGHKDFAISAGENGKSGPVLEN